MHFRFHRLLFLNPGPKMGLSRVYSYSGQPGLTMDVMFITPLNDSLVF